MVLVVVLSDNNLEVWQMVSASTQDQAQPPYDVGAATTLLRLGSVQFGRMKWQV